jgi:tRNA U34 5-carboxymethylaminomethyl modifying GTPase MnmE/TrmE
VTLTESTAAAVAALDALTEFLGSAALAPWPQRSDDVARLAAARERLLRRFTLAVVGEFSSGKSYLLNALLGEARYDPAGRVAGLLATDINPSTATITELEYAAEASASARYPSGRVERIPLDRLARFVAVGGEGPGGLHDALADDDTAPSFVTVGVASPFLERGFVVADTPGLASLNPAHRRATLAYLPRSDAVLYLIDTQQPFSEGDAAFLGIIGEHVSTIFIIQTKIDLWRMRESDGREAWEHARERIAARAALSAPTADVFAVSAREFALGTLEADAALREASGFPALLAALDRSLELRARSARIARSGAVAAEIVARTSARLRREAALLETGQTELHERFARAEIEIAERERALVRERDAVARAGTEREAWFATRGETLGADLQRALASALDVADIERLRDRARLHSLVDATAAQVLSRFARESAADTARELERVAREHPALGVADVAAVRLGGEPGVGAWSRDLASGLTSTIVLGALGGPAVSFVQRVSAAFSAHAPGTYMKRELRADSNAAFFPQLESEVRDYVAGLGASIAAIYGELAETIERERRDVRAETLEPIARAVELAGDESARKDARERLRGALERLAAIDAELRRNAATASESREPVRAAAQEYAQHRASFDADAYDRGLRPERYRVVVLGALRRGKSSLINAIAETRILQDDAGREATFPIHVRYGEAERAFALEAQGIWHEIPLDRAIAQAAETPVLIEVPWKMPRELVLVHAPAFDSGDDGAQQIALAAAGAASEVLALFSRQLSDRELEVYRRVAELGKPMLLAHTIADNETATERRNVVELAGRYVEGRNIPVRRIFTISALDYLEHLHTGRPAAAWNELGALRETLRAHAEEHMQRLAERARRTPAPAAAQALHEVSSRPKLRDALRRLLGREP